MLDKNNEVFFEEYCKTCKYKNYSETDSPCAECIAEPVNLYSHKPVKWEGADGIFAGPPPRPDHAYQRAVKYVPEKRKDKEKAIARLNIDAEYSGNKVQTIDNKVTDDQYPSATAVKKALENKIDAPQTAAVGEVLTVEEVGEDGKPKKWKTAPAAAEQKQANWAQNDETAADYVKNRPGGYYGDLVTVDEEIYSGEIKQTSTEMLTDWLLVAGQTYKVTVGEVEKTYTAFADSYSDISGVTIGDATIGEAAGAEEIFALMSVEIEEQKIALMVCPEADLGKTIHITQFGTAREVHKIPAEFLDIPPAEQVPQVVTVRLVERDGRQYGSMTFGEVLAAQRGGKEVRLLDSDGHYFQFTGIYNADENICFHSFRQHTLWWASMERSGVIEIYGYNLGQQELTYSADSTYTSLYDKKSFSCSFIGSWTRIKFFITLRLLTITAGAYVQLRYDKGRKILNICKHEEIGTGKAILCGELEKTTTGNYTYLVTLRLRNENGTPHPAQLDFCDELNLDSVDTDFSPMIEILSGTEDKFAARQSIREYCR